MATQQNGIVAGNKQNAPGGSTKNARSIFPFSMSQFQTERFADLTPFEVMEGVSSDKLPLHSNHEVQTYTLKSPILQSLSKKKDFFAVPMQAILPLNWEKFYTNPNIGDDVPDDCGLGVEAFWNKMRTLFYNSWSYLTNFPQAQDFTEKRFVEYCLRFALFFEQIYSCGSLMETLNISGHNWFRCKRTDSLSVSTVVYEYTFDDFFDGLCSKIAGYLEESPNLGITVTIGNVNYSIVHKPVEFSRSAVVQISLREALELMRDDLTFTVDSVPATELVQYLDQYLGELDFEVYGGTSPLNLGRLWAYQLVCAHFMSNDHIDFIYSAELFRQYILKLVNRKSGTAPYPTYVGNFIVNGLEYQYDALSAYCFNHVISAFGNNGLFGYTTPSGAIGPDSLSEVYAYFTALFGFKKSLRFLDYFSGSRSYPLAVGDHNATIGTDVAGKLDVIELSRVSMMTKFLQAVNRSGRKFSAYMQELFGKVPAYDYHNPMFLAHQSDLVGAPETENTGAAQVTDKIAVTSRLKATASRYAFEFTPDRDCIVIGITYYDIPRVYTRATERQNFVIDRFDMFNTYLQYTGDQPISEAELGTNTPDFDKPFSYTNRDMQYKQRFNQANGGFCVPSTGLDNWIFVADELRRKYFHNISPSFIRSFNCEIDRFYQRLTGYSLGTYFHFIVRYDNRMDASRPMAFNPTINV